MADRKRISLEEDFRNYEERDTRDGWPYPDDDDARCAAQNVPYGTPGADLDQLDNEGVASTRDPIARNVDGAPLLFADETADIIADDDLEGRIMETLEDNDRVDLATLDLTIRDGVPNARRYRRQRGGPPPPHRLPTPYERGA